MLVEEMTLLLAPLPATLGNASDATAIIAAVSAAHAGAWLRYFSGPSTLALLACSHQVRDCSQAPRNVPMEAVAGAAWTRLTVHVKLALLASLALQLVPEAMMGPTYNSSHRFRYHTPNGMVLVTSRHVLSKPAWCSTPMPRRRS
jgi:hypothetical protein